MSRNEYDILYDLIWDKLNPDDLETLCVRYFPDIYKNFRPQWEYQQMINVLLKEVHQKRDVKLPILHQALREKLGSAYDNAFPEGPPSTSAPTPPPTPAPVPTSPAQTKPSAQSSRPSAGQGLASLPPLAWAAIGGVGSIVIIILIIILWPEGEGAPAALPSPTQAVAAVATSTASPTREASPTAEPTATNTATPEPSATAVLPNTATPTTAAAVPAAATATATTAPTETATATATPAPTENPNVPPADAALGDTWTRPIDDMVMVYVPAPDAPFVLMSGVDAPTEGYWIDKYEVSNAQYQLCVAARACDQSAFSRDASYNGDTYPVVGVDWADAVAYSAWVGGALPTEGEWEYAAVGDSGFLYPWGNRFNATYLNCRDAICRDGYSLTAPVDSFPDGASWVGALNMAGNVWEWTSSWFDTTEVRRVLRGGGFSSSDQAFMRFRYSNVPTSQLADNGFRVVFRTP